MNAISIGIVDDDDAVRDSVQVLLESAGFDVVTFASGRSLLDYPRLGDLACIVLDIDMPDLSGLDCLNRLRRQKSDIPVILTSGAVTPMLRRATDRSETVLLEKPFAGESLLAAITAIRDARLLQREPNRLAP